MKTTERNLESSTQMNVDEITENSSIDITTTVGQFAGEKESSTVLIDTTETSEKDIFEDSLTTKATLVLFNDDQTDKDSISDKNTDLPFILNDRTSDKDSNEDINNEIVNEADYESTTVKDLQIDGEKDGDSKKDTNEEMSENESATESVGSENIDNDHNFQLKNTLGSPGINNNIGI